VGRPPKSPEDKHSETVRIPLRPADFARLQSNADKAETSITDFVRATALGHTFNVVQSNAPDFDTMQELRRIGVNLNQIAKQMNAQKTVKPSELTTACQKLERLLERWLIHDPQNNHRPQF